MNKRIRKKRVQAAIKSIKKFKVRPGDLVVLTTDFEEYTPLEITQIYNAAKDRLKTLGCEVMFVDKSVDVSHYNKDSCGITVSREAVDAVLRNLFVEE